MATVLEADIVLTMSVIVIEVLLLVLLLPLPESKDVRSRPNEVSASENCVSCSAEFGLCV